MRLYESERVALFIDGANTHNATRALGFNIDYRRLLTLFRSRCHLIRAYYYTVIDDDEQSSVRPLVDWLEYNGFTLVTKPTRNHSSAAGYRKFRISMDVEIAVDAMQLADKIDHAVLFCGDGDFVCLVAALQAMGKRVSVVSTLDTRPAMVAAELRRQADQFIDLAVLADLVARDNQPVRAPSAHAR